MEKYNIKKDYKITKTEYKFNKDNIKTYKENVYIKKLSLGFHTYYADCIKRLIDDTLKKIKDNKIINIINDCYYDINEYDKTIKEEFKKKYKIEYNDNEYYKLYEVLKNFEINIKDTLTFDEYTEKIIKDIFKTNVNKIKIKEKENNTYTSIIYNSKINFDTNQEEILINDFYNIIKYIIDNLNTKGDFVIKIYSNFLLLTNQLILILTNLFKDVYFYIPDVSEIYENEKYIICKEFNKDNKIIKDLNEILNKKENIYDCGIELNEGYNKEITKINNELVVYQAYWSNKLIEYINKQNFYGEDYNKYRNVQINYTEKWIDKFL